MTGDFQRAAGLGPKVLKGDKDGWETWIHSFAQHQQLPVGFPLSPL
jgi:hypothetical protein